MCRRKKKVVPLEVGTVPFGTNIYYSSLLELLGAGGDVRSVFLCENNHSMYVDVLDEEELVKCINKPCTRLKKVRIGRAFSLQPGATVANTFGPGAKKR